MTASSADYIRLLGRAERAGTYRLPADEREALLDASRALGYPTLDIDFSGDTDKDTALATIARALSFPEWFGANWDALADCLSDLSWCEAPGYVLRLEAVDDLAGSAPADFATLLEIFEMAAANWREAGVPFWVMVDSAEQDMPTPLAGQDDA